MSEPAATNLHEYTVSEISGALKRTVEDAFGYVRVRGELGRVTRAGSGHVYLDMKDDKAVLNGVVWKGVAGRLRIQPEQGLEVVATGKLTTFPGQSRYQIVIDSMEPAGVGALMALLEERKKKLAAEGLFDEARKKPLPYLPETIGVVTSPTGAVIRDILHRLRDRFPRRVLLWPTLVQGEQAKTQVASAIAGFNALSPGGPVPRPDVLIVARGGGSIEDLWAFNEEAVVRAAAASDIPLISAVGHETDTTLIDFASDRRAPTPTAAAEMAVPVRAELAAQVLTLERRLVAAEARMFEAARTELRAAARGLGRPEDVLRPAEQRLDNAGARLTAAGQALARQAATRLAAAAGRLTAATLTRGFVQRRRSLADFGARLKSAEARRLQSVMADLERLRPPAGALVREIETRGRRVADLQGRLTGAGARRLASSADRVGAAARLLDSLSHQKVLARGFALARRPNGSLIRSAAVARDGEAVDIVFADGARPAVFGPGATSDGTAPPKAQPDKPTAEKPAGKSKTPARGGRAQASLFDD